MSVSIKCSLKNFRIKELLFVNYPSDQAVNTIYTAKKLA